MVSNGSLNKPASQWQLRDLRELAGAEPQESLYLEFKKPREFVIGGNFSGDKLAEELAETASAFLNAEGGIILLGVQTTKVDARTELLKPLDQWDYQYTLESAGIPLKASQVLDRVNSNLAPPPFEIEAQAIDVSLANGKTTIFVVSVPASVTAAHQSTRSRRYYKRIADGDQPMLDYEIRDVNNRRSGPMLALVVRIAPTDASIPRTIKDGGLTTSFVAEDGPRSSPAAASLEFALANHGRATATIARYEVGLPSLLRPLSSSSTEFYRDSRLDEWVGTRPTVFRGKRVDEQPLQWYSGIYLGGTTHRHPLWPSPSLEGIAYKTDVKVTRPTLYEGTIRGWIPWRLYAEGMNEVRGAASIVHSDEVIEVRNYGLGETDWAGSSEDDRHLRLLGNNPN